jgi:hypothetical protein
MKYIILNIIAFFLISIGATAQGTVRGKITDERTD